MILLLTFALAITPTEHFKIVCEVTCQQDGDETGIAVNQSGSNVCYCSNKRNVKVAPIKIPRQYSAPPTIPKGYYE